MSLSEDGSSSTLDGNFYTSDSIPGDLRVQWPESTILSLMILALTVLLGVPGNGAVVWVTGFKVKRTVHTVCFLNLAVADLTYCLILLFLVAFYLVQSWSRNHIFGDFLPRAVTLNLSASAFLLTLISVYRCLAVTRPIWFRQHLRLAWVCAACFGAWGLAVLACLPILLSWQIVRYLGYKTWVLLEVTWAVFTFGLPVGIMAACYLLIVWELRGDQFAESRKPVRLIVTVVAAFIVCWLLFNVSLLLQNSQRVPTGWIYISLALASFNSALNPLLYVFVGRDFRQVFRRSPAASLRLAFAQESSQLGRVPADNTVSSEIRV